MAATRIYSLVVCVLTYQWSVVRAISFNHNHIAGILNVVEDALLGLPDKVWHPESLTDRKDLECNPDRQTLRQWHIEDSAKGLEKYCSCKAEPRWKGKQLRLQLEYVSVLGKAVVFSEEPVNRSLVYEVVHSHGVLTDMPVNLCNWETDTHLQKTYEAVFNETTDLWDRIVVIDLSFNQIRRTVDINCLANLDNMDLSFNKIEFVSNTSFNKLTHLRILNLRNNIIKTMQPGTFFSESMHLTNVDMANNEMKDIDISNVFSNFPFCEFDFSNNKLETMSNALGLKLDTTSNRTYGPGMVTFQGNSFQRFPDFEELLGLTDIAQLGRLMEFGFDFRNIDLECDCLLEPLLEKAKEFIKTQWRDYMAVKCNAPAHLQGKPVVNVTLDDFICQMDDDPCCPRTCSCTAQPSQNRVIVNCSRRSLPEFPTNVCQTKHAQHVELYLDHNSIREVHYESFLGNVTVLDLSNNGALSHIDEDAASALSSATRIDLSGNPGLNHLPMPLQYKNLSVVNMSGIILTCGCDERWLWNWKSVRGKDQRADFMCDVPNHGVLHTSQVSDELLNCNQEDPLYIRLTISIGTVLIVVCVIAGLVFQFKYELLILVLRMRQTTAGAVSPTFDYDVFLSFDDENETLRQWVSFHLLSYLEEAGYKTFYSLRDMTVGGTRSSETIGVLQKTKNFILILSESYINQDDHIWTDNEWKYGWHMLMEDARRKIVLINYDHVSSFDVDHPQIKAFLRVGRNVEFTNHQGNLLDMVRQTLGPPCAHEMNPHPSGMDNKKQRFMHNMFVTNFDKGKGVDENEVNILNNEFPSVSDISKKKTFKNSTFTQKVRWHY